MGFFLADKWPNLDGISIYHVLELMMKLLLKLTLVLSGPYYGEISKTSQKVL